jgi:hypothetical protein
MSWFAFMAFALITSARADHSECAAIPGAATVLSDQSIKTIVVGEMHGTNETPAIFADLTCLAASSGRNVVVALEHPTTEQPAIDQFMASDGDPAALLALTASVEWHSPYPDGRTSAARLALLRRLREMIRAKQVNRVVAIMPTARLSSSEYEKAMARNVANAGGENDLVLALVGNVHALLLPWESSPGITYLPMAANLTRGSTKTLNATGNGGSAWVCMPSCGSHDFGPARTSYPRGIKLLDGVGKPYDGFLNLGVPTTVSLPLEPR